MILKQISFFVQSSESGGQLPPLPAFGRVIFCVTLFCIGTDWEIGDPRRER
jgi:hypothetical protein